MKSVVKTCSAFSLVELMIVVAILGILAAIVFPEFQGHTQRAKEAAAKDNLRILRQAIERYAAEHNGVPPGYQNNDTAQKPNYLYAFGQLTYGPSACISDLPKNPFNRHKAFLVISDTGAFPTEPTLPTIYGWIYKPATRTIRLNWTGTDSEGVKYFDY